MCRYHSRIVSSYKCLFLSVQKFIGREFRATFRANAKTDHTGTREALSTARLPKSRHVCTMASIQAIEQTSVHQIQSGQVIVDLNSVVKELVENSLDAGSTSIEVRFRNHGLDAIEVIDNGTGIAPEDFESVGTSYRSESSVLCQYLTRSVQHSSITHLNYGVTMISRIWIPLAFEVKH